MSQKKLLNFGELFVGAGGLSLGFLLANHPKIQFNSMFGIDNDEESLSTYKVNMEWLHKNATSLLPNTPIIIKQDIRKLSYGDLPLGGSGTLDLLIGGAPCQGFSTSNRSAKNEQKSEKNNLAKSFLDHLILMKPKMFLIENVQGVGWTKPTDDMKFSLVQDLAIPDETTVKSVKDFLIQVANIEGYKTWSKILNARDFGVPQNRLRFILFGVRYDLIPEEKNIHLEKFLAKYLSAAPSVYEAIFDLPSLENGFCWDEKTYCPKIENEYISKMRFLMKDLELHDHRTTNHKEYVVERFKKIPQGGNWLSIRDNMTNYKKIDNTHSNIYRRLLADAPAHTISHYRKSMTIHPTQHRGLSLREACRLQSFPDWFRFQGKSDSQQQQLANAVPPLLASAIASAIADFVIEKEIQI